MDTVSSFFERAYVYCVYLLCIPVFVRWTFSGAVRAEFRRRKQRSRVAPRGNLGGAERVGPTLFDTFTERPGKSFWKSFSTFKTPKRNGFFDTLDVCVEILQGPNRHVNFSLTFSSGDHNIFRGDPESFFFSENRFWRKTIGSVR